MSATAELLAHQPVHPQANRWVEHNGLRLYFHLRRRSRKTIGLQVGREGLLVSAPRWALVSDIQQAVQERAAWAVDKLRQAREHEQAQRARRLIWGDGMCMPYLGRPLQIRVVRPPIGEADPSVLWLNLADDAGPITIRNKVQDWMRARARSLFEQRLNHFAPQLNVVWRRLRLSSAKTRWGSASAAGGISLNWRLMHHPMEVIDYVVVHELSHLRVMNHSPAFWQTVERVLPDYRQRMQALKNDNAMPVW